MNHWHSFTTSSVSDGYIWSPFHGGSTREQAAGGPAERVLLSKGKEALLDAIKGLLASTDTWAESQGSTRDARQAGISQSPQRVQTAWAEYCRAGLSLV